MAAYINILMADDDMEDRMIVKQSFKEIYPSDEIDFAEDGIELLSALDKGRQEKKLPKLILLDLNMPRLNGVETLRKLKDVPEYNSIPVVIFSTAVNDMQRDECLSLGAQHYITKPATYDEATNIIHFIHNFALQATA